MKDECCNCFHVCTYSECCTVQFGIQGPRTVRCPLSRICPVENKLTSVHLCWQAQKIKKIEKNQKSVLASTDRSRIPDLGSMTRRAL